MPCTCSPCRGAGGWGSFWSQPASRGLCPGLAVLWGPGRWCNQNALRVAVSDCPPLGLITKSLAGIFTSCGCRFHPLCIPWVSVITTGGPVLLSPLGIRIIHPCPSVLTLASHKVVQPPSLFSFKTEKNRQEFYNT